MALLLGVNMDLLLESISANSSNKSEKLDNLSEKIHYEQIDPNSMTILSFMYENLQTTFHNQFNKFKLEKKLVLSQNFVNWSSDAFNTLEYSSKPVLGIEVRSSSGYDYDSSTYLFDSSTISSFASNEHKNKKKAKLDESSGSENKSKSKTIGSDSNNSDIIGIKRLASLENSASDSNMPKRRKSLSHTKIESSFDDGLCVKIMQNYIDVFGAKDPFLNSEEDNIKNNKN